MISMSMRQRRGGNLILADYQSILAGNQTGVEFFANTTQ